MGIGGSSAQRDRTDVLSSRSDAFNVFNYGLPTAQASQTAGTGVLDQSLATLGPAENYYRDILTGGRTQTAERAAPAINSALAGADATRKQEAVSGTGRTGGTAELNREAAATTQSSIDNIINSTLQTGRKEGAAGLTQVAGEKAGIGSEFLANALGNLGISESTISQIMQNSMDSRGQSNEIGQQAGSAVGSLILAGLGSF